jgi:hypothetical protein
VLKHFSITPAENSGGAEKSTEKSGSHAKNFFCSMYEMSQRHPVWVAENHVNPCNRAGAIFLASYWSAGLRTSVLAFHWLEEFAHTVCQWQEKLSHLAPLTLSEAPAAKQSTFTMDQLHSTCD